MIGPEGKSLGVAVPCRVQTSSKFKLVRFIRQKSFPMCAEAGGGGGFSSCRSVREIDRCCYYEWLKEERSVMFANHCASYDMVYGVYLHQLVIIYSHGISCKEGVAAGERL